MAPSRTGDMPSTSRLLAGQISPAWRPWRHRAGPVGPWGGRRRALSARADSCGSGGEPRGQGVRISRVLGPSMRIVKSASGGADFASLKPAHWAGAVGPWGGRRGALSARAVPPASGVEPRGRGGRSRRVLGHSVAMGLMLLVSSVWLHFHLYTPKFVRITHFKSCLMGIQLRFAKRSWLV
jgi:hypothetical protein